MRVVAQSGVPLMEEAPVQIRTPVEAVSFTGRLFHAAIPHRGKTHATRCRKG